MSAQSPGTLKGDFAFWMRGHLGYASTELNVPTKARQGAPGRPVAVRGETYGSTWRRLRSVSLLALATAILLRNVDPTLDEGSLPLPSALFVVGTVAYAVARIGRARTREYTWAECKDQGRPVSRDDILDLDAAVRTARGREQAEWQASRVLMVAGSNGFHAEAVALARSLGIECHRRGGPGFERAD